MYGFSYTNNDFFHNLCYISRGGSRPLDEVRPIYEMGLNLPVDSDGNMIVDVKEVTVLMTSQAARKQSVFRYAEHFIIS